MSKGNAWECMVARAIRSDALCTPPRDALCMRCVAEYRLNKPTNGVVYCLKHQEMKTSISHSSGEAMSFRRHMAVLALPA